MQGAKEKKLLLNKAKAEVSSAHMLRKEKIFRYIDSYIFIYGQYKLDM